MRLKKLIGFLLILLLVFIAVDWRLAVREYVVESARISTPVRLALLTDFHGCDYGSGAQRLVKAVEMQNPDIVLLAGDIFDDQMPWDASEALVKTLAASYPCFYVTGNHEYWSGRVAEICTILETAGVTVLDMTCATVTVRGERLNICGIPDPYAMKYCGAPSIQDQLERALQGADPEACTVLLAHRPELIEQYVAAGRIDLVVSGHAHGGQVRLPGLINGLFAPNQGWFPAYAGGEYHVQDTTLIVSRGLARESTMLPRVFNRPELVMIELQ